MVLVTCFIRALGEPGCKEPVQSMNDTFSLCSAHYAGMISSLNFYENQTMPVAYHVPQNTI